MRIEEELNPKIFISYSHDDIDFANKLSNRLISEGYNLWIDVNNIRAREKFSKEIELGIYESSIFVSLISKSYITKDFCEDEIECAKCFGKELVPLYIEKVIIPPGSGYVLSYSRSEVGYGKDIVTEEDFEALYKGFLEGIELFIKSGNSERFKVKKNIKFEALRNNFEQLSLGGYAVDEIYTELFPAITVEGVTMTDDDDSSSEYKNALISTDDNNKALIDYIEENSKSHIFIQGEGGAGKTVALKRIFEYFYSKDIPTVYVPLNKVGFSKSNRDALEKYMSEIACRNAGWSNIKQLALHAEYEPRVVLMLDGLNEITGEDVQGEAIHQIKEKMCWSNLQIIITSRIDYTEKFTDVLKIKHIKLEPISKEKICMHLSSKGVDMVKSSQLLHLLSNPMMLTLYTETKMNSEYLNQIKKSSLDFDYFRIRITENPDTAGKIIWNYVISQLYKSSKQVTSSSETIKNFVTTEIFLPFFGYSLVKDVERTAVDYSELRTMMPNFQKTEYFKMYKEDRVEDLKFQTRTAYDITNYEPLDFVKVTTNQLRFINESDRKLEFVHQIFRDFFAALFISKQIENLASDYGEKEFSYDVIVNQRYSGDIIDYLVDILGETQGRPQKNSDGIIFPGKKSNFKPSDFSVAEKAMGYFKGLEGKSPQIGVSNLFEIMKVGRNLNLSNCDFSGLDLRFCDLSGVLFVDWYKEKTYPSCFDEAYIDIESFVSPGHNVSVSAIHARGDRIYSGDVSGVVKIWSLDSDYPLISHKVTSGEPVIDMVYSEDKGVLGVLTSYRLYSFDPESAKVELLCETHNYYKYIKIDENGEFLVSMDVEPLTWSDVNGILKSEEMPFKATCGCVAKNPIRDEFLVGVLYNNAYLFRNENGSEYSVFKRIDLHNENAFIKDVCYSSDGTSFIVATNKTVSEFDSGSLVLRHRMDFDGRVSSVECFDDKIVVATGSGIVILDKDFSVKKRYKGKKICNNVSVLLDDEKMFICSARNKIFEMTREFTVKRARKVSTGSHICIGNYGKGKSCFILINDGKKNETGYRYDFETAEINELTYNYEIVTESYNTDDYPYDIVKKENTIVFTNKENVDDKKEFVFYPNINIFDCSFRNVKGNIRETENLEFVIMYGGVV